MLGRTVFVCLLFSTLNVFFATTLLAETLIVLNKNEATATLYDVKTGNNIPIATVPTGPGPHEVDVSPNGLTAVVSNYGYEKPGTNLTIIDIPNGKVADTIELDGFTRPHGVLWYPDNRHVLITAEADDAVLIVDIVNRNIVGTISTGQKISHMVTADFDRKRAYTANIVSGSVSVLDLEKRELIKVIPTGIGGEGFALTPDGNQLWVTSRAGNNIAVIDTQSLSLVDQVDAGNTPIRVTFTPDGRNALISNAASGDVTIVETDRLMPSRRVVFDGKVNAGKVPVYANRFVENSIPAGTVVNAAGDTAYIAHTRANLVSVLDLKSMRIKKYLQTGLSPDGMALSTWTFPEEGP